MRQRRYLAPWHRKVLDANDLSLDGEEAAAALSGLMGKPAIYHVISRVVDRQFLFGGEEKEHFVRLMRLYERFCGLRVLSFAVMSNHFHILLSGCEKEAAEADDKELLRRYRKLYPQLTIIGLFVGEEGEIEEIEIS